MNLTPTESQKKRIAIMIAIQAYRDENGYPPSFHDVSKSVGMNYNGAEHHLSRLREKGLVTWEPKITRTLRLTQKGKDYLESLGS